MIDRLTFNYLLTKTLLTMRIEEGSVYLTRKCNLSCHYCKLPKTNLRNELDIQQWIEAFAILEKIGIETVNVLGGEPTLVEGIEVLINYLNKKTDLQYYLISNSLFPDELMEKLVRSELKAYVTSIDDISSGDSSSPHIRKSNAGLRMLGKLRNEGVPFLCGNIVISALNIDRVVDVVQYLNDFGIWANVCPVIWGKRNAWERREEVDEAYRLNESHMDKLTEISNQLVEMKRRGFLILPSEAYLKNIPTYGINLNWKCFSEGKKTYPSRLRIDADGAVMSCIDFRGRTAEKFSVFDLADESKYQDFQEQWYDDVKHCSGCYWSSMFLAKERQVPNT